MAQKWIKQRAFEFDWIKDGRSLGLTRVVYRYYADGNTRGMTLPIGHPRYDTEERIEQAFDSIMGQASLKLRTDVEFDEFFLRDMQAHSGIEVVDRPFYLRRAFGDSSRQDWNEWQERRRQACNPAAEAA